jgi:hypothetical protein
MTRERLGLLAALLLSLGSAAFIYFDTQSISAHTVVKDQWRFVHEIDDYYQGRFSAADLLESHSNHIKIGYKALFLASGVLFDLDMDFERALGILSLAFLCWMLFIAVRGTELGRDPPMLFAVYLCILLFSFSEVRWNYFQYSLLSISSFVGWIFFLGFWFAAEAHCRGRWRGHRALIACVALLFLMVFGFGGGRSPAVLLVTLLGFGGLAVAESALRRRVLVFLAVMVGLAALLETGYWMLVAEYAKKTDVGLGYQTALHDITGAFVFGLRALTAGVVHYVRLQDMSIGMQVAIGALLFAAHLLAFGLYLWMRAWRRSLIPVMLILYSGCFVGEIIIARFGLGYDNSIAPRYVAETMMGLLGCVWIYGLALQRLSGSGRRRLAAGLLACLVLGVGALQWDDYMAGRRMQRAEKVHFSEQVDLLRQGRFTELAKWYCPAPALCAEDDQILRRYKLVPYDQP